MKKQLPKSYSAVIWQRFQQHRSAYSAFRVLVVLFWIALLSPFIASDVPIYAKIKDESSFPFIKKILINWGVLDQTAPFRSENYWHDQQYEEVILPLIPYSATYQDTRNVHFTSPFGPQRIDNNRYWHWLGTDHLGRDIAAGMIRGLIVTLQVGLISLLLASVIGIFLGGIAGYFGDHHLKIRRGVLILLIPGIVLSVFYGVVVRSFWLAEGIFWQELFKSLFILAGGIGTSLLAGQLISRRIPFFQKKISIPADILVMRMIEIVNAVPGLLLIIALSATFVSQSIWTIIWVIAAIAWTNIARYVRAELLKVRELDFIRAGKALGYTDLRILFRHALPNAMGPALVVIAFGIANAILAESTLAFLGIGVGANHISWGTMLQLARNQPDKWWLAILPGLAIFMMVMIFNLIGEGLKNAVEGK